MAGTGGKRDGAGRKPGGKNKKTKQWEVFAEYCLNGGLEKYQEELEKLKGKDFITAYQNQLEYFAPKLSRAEIKQETKGDININVNRT